MQDTTKELIEILKSTSPNNFEKYEQNYLNKRTPSFYDYISQLIEKKGWKRQHIIIRANLPQKYGYKLLSGETHTTDRDKILRICFSMEMSLKEAQTALKLYGMNELYPKIKRDAMIIIAFNNKLYWIDEINEWLTEQGELPL